MIAEGDTTGHSWPGRQRSSSSHGGRTFQAWAEDYERERQLKGMREQAHHDDQQRQAAKRKAAKQLVWTLSNHAL